MTANQINYARLREDIRHNMRTEDLSQMGNEIAFAKAYSDQRNAETNAKNAETNLLNASLRRDELLETHRSNVAKESLSAQQLQLSGSQLAETMRANRANEYLTSERNAETHRSNVIGESQNSFSLWEMQRHNTSTEQNTQTQTRASIVNTLINGVTGLIGRLAH